MNIMLRYKEYRSWYVWFFGARMETGEYRYPYPYEAASTYASRGLSAAI